MNRRSFLPVLSLALCTAASADVINVGPGESIQAAIDSAAPGDEIVVAAGVYGEAIDFDGKAITVRSSAGPDVTILDGGNAFRIVTFDGGEGPGSVLDGFTIRNGSGPSCGGCSISSTCGGGMFIDGSSPVINGCRFEDNHGNHGAALTICSGSPLLRDCVFYENDGGTISAIAFRGNGYLILDHCDFLDNHAESQSGCVFAVSGSILGIDCLFRDNDTGISVANAADVTLVSCVFDRHVTTSGPTGGGISAAGDVTAINCVFSNNTAPRGGGIYAHGQTTLTNCTLTGNLPAGVMYDDDVTLQCSNTIAWGNAFGQIIEDPTFPGGPVTVDHSCIEGGWSGSGTGNTDANPLFVQPGAGDYRLAAGSPCLDTGDDAALPEDEFDLDGDGDTAETLPLDLAGASRVQGPAVDMGAYEGEHAALPPASGNPDFDAGEVAILVPSGGPPDALQDPWSLMFNASGPDDASVLVTELVDDVHPDAGSFGELGSILCVETTLNHGQHASTVYVPFNESILRDADPFSMVLTAYQPTLGTWIAAVQANTQNSAGYPGPVGDRVLVEGPSDPGVTHQIGDHGVYFDPSLGQGYAWAVVDHATDFAVGAQLCAGDCAPAGGDEQVGVRDLLAVLLAWDGSPAATGCDVDIDGVVDVGDLLVVIESWGDCE